MKFFLDTANIEEIKKANATGLIDGITTNPSLAAKENKDFEKLIKEISGIVKGPISAEVISTNYKDMIKEAKKLSKINKNIVIKIPMTADGIIAVKELTEKGIKTNVTLVFSANQALLAAKAGATYVSPFIGRLDDLSNNGMELIEEIRIIFNNYKFKTKILTASIRSVLHVKQASLLGSDVATIPPKIFWELFNHPLTDKGLNKFLEDWNNAKKPKKQINEHVDNNGFIKNYNKK